MRNYSFKSYWISLFIIIIFFSSGHLMGQDYIDDLSNIDNSVPSTYGKTWDITRKAPYLIFNGNSAEMQVLWQLTSTTNCTIEWGLDSTYSIGSVQTTEYGGDYQHSYVITNLQAATKYYYRVTAGTDIHYGSFISAPDATAENVKFFAYGDTRSYPADHNTVAGKILNEISADQEFQTIIISVGDLVNQGNYESDWDNQFFNPSYPNILSMLSQLPYQACMGNHEQSGLLFQKYFPYPFVGGRYWSFDYGPMHFVVVDQYTNYGPGSTQLTWIENDLATTNKLWKFIYLHEPGWTAGGHSNNSSVQNYIQPLCEQYNVPIVFAGHNHYYARAVVNDVHHITTGGGGAPLYTPYLTYPNVVSVAQAHHFCKIEIDGDILNFSSIDVDNDEIDNFAINKYGIIPYNVTVSNSFAQMGSDSLLVLSELKNPQNHTVNMYAKYIATQHTFTDSVQLFDDGNHGDGSIGDGIWGNYIEPLQIEDEFTIDMVVDDVDSTMYFVAPKLARFTTIGPIILHNYRISHSDTIPHHLDRRKFEFTLQNSGSTTTAHNISSQITSLDSFSIVSPLVTSVYGNILPGNNVTATNKQYIKFDLGDQDSVNVKFRIDIFSNDYLFWADTFSVFVHKDPTGIIFENKSIPDKLVLKQNYPNPFNPLTNINFQIPSSDMVTLRIYNITGQKIETLVSQKLSAGSYEYPWNATDIAGGVYYYRLTTGKGFNQTRKMILMK